VGKGVVDMIDSRAARKETPAWRNLIKWIDAQPKASPTTVDDLRRRPAVAVASRNESPSTLDERPLSA
jgi:hypothetical protein